MSDQMYIEREEGKERGGGRRDMSMGGRERKCNVVVSLGKVASYW